MKRKEKAHFFHAFAEISHELQTKYSLLDELKHSLGRNDAIEHCINPW